MPDNTDDETLDNPTNTQSEKPSDEIIPLAEPDIITPKQETKNMDTHAHHLHHAPGKKFRHYLYEFLMLFLAVFCGFLAENLREYQVERNREKQYMGSLISDLKDDTLIITKHIASLEKSIILLDSLSILLDSPELAKKNGEAIYYASRVGNRTSPLVNNSRTFDQLTNSGSFRLISNSETSNRIMNYYAILPELRMVEGIFKSENEAYKAAASRVIDPAIYRKQINADGSIARITGNPALLSYDAALLKQLEFYEVQLNGSRLGMIHLLKTLKQSGGELLKYLQATYHLK